MDRIKQDVKIQQPERGPKEEKELKVIGMNKLQAQLLQLERQKITAGQPFAIEDIEKLFLFLFIIIKPEDAKQKGYAAAYNIIDYAVLQELTVKLMKTARKQLTRLRQEYADKEDKLRYLNAFEELTKDGKLPDNPPKGSPAWNARVNTGVDYSDL